MEAFLGNFPSFSEAAIPQGPSESESDGRTDVSFSHLTKEKCFEVT